MNWVESITVLAALSVASGENKLEKEENANELGEKFQFLKRKLAFYHGKIQFSESNLILWTEWAKES